MNGTVKQFKDALDKMKEIYPYDDSKTNVSTRNPISNDDDYIEICTLDENAGIRIIMGKQIRYEDANISEEQVCKSIAHDDSDAIMREFVLNNQREGCTNTRKTTIN